MNGYRFQKADHLHPDCKTKLDVLVYSLTEPPDWVKGVCLCELPPNVGQLFRQDYRLHAVVTALDGTVIEANRHIL